LYNIFYLGFSFLPGYNGTRMKSIGFLLLRVFLVSFCGTFLLSATETVKEDPFPFWFPTYAAQGNSSIAYSDGFGALLSNPAGFALPKQEVNLLSWGFTLYSSPQARIPLLRSLIRSSTSGQDEELLSKEFTEKGLGVASSLGIGYVGRGLGLGLLAGFDVVAGGDTYPLGLRGDGISQFMLVVGYAVRKELGGVKFSFGGDIRPIVRIHAPMREYETALLLKQYIGTEITPLSGDFYSDTFALNGSGIGFDVGGLIQWNSFSLGVVFRDVFDTQLFYSWNDLDSIRTALGNGGLPPVNSVPGNAVYSIPMSTVVGVAYDLSFDRLKRLFWGRIHGEWENPTKFLHDPTWTNAKDAFRFGCEATFFSFLNVRAGFEGGSPTYGGGLKFAIFEANVAIFSRKVELPERISRVPAVSLELAIRW